MWVWQFSGHEESEVIIIVESGVTKTDLTDTTF